MPGVYYFCHKVILDPYICMNVRKIGILKNIFKRPVSQAAQGSNRGSSRHLVYCKKCLKRSATGQTPSPGAVTVLPAQALQGNMSPGASPGQKVPELYPRGSHGSWLFGISVQALASQPWWSKAYAGLCGAKDWQSFN